MLNNYKGSLFNNKIILKLQQIFKSDHHNVYTEQINKIVLTSNDGNRFQTFDKVTTRKKYIQSMRKQDAKQNISY